MNILALLRIGETCRFSVWGILAISRVPINTLPWCDNPFWFGIMWITHSVDHGCGKLNDVGAPVMGDFCKLELTGDFS